jgi:hypothetical protein
VIQEINIYKIPPLDQIKKIMTMNNLNNLS